MEKPIIYVGPDVRKERIAVALADEGKRGEVREHGKIGNTPAALTKLVGKLGRVSRDLRFCYEVGPCGYGIQLQLSTAGHEYVVVAPSLIPIKVGDRIKTDCRDAIKLAKLHRVGELTAVWISDQAHEVVRDLVRARLKAIQLATGLSTTVWVPAASRPALQPAGLDAATSAVAGGTTVRTARALPCPGGLRAVIEAGTARRDCLEAYIEVAPPDWSLGPVVWALQSLRDVALIAAATLVAELGDMTRFANPRQLMAYLGLMPSEHSSGSKRRQGASHRLETAQDVACWYALGE